MLARGFGILIAICAAWPAVALEACFEDSVGPWRGPVWNGNGLQTMDTTFHIGPDGALTGTYHIRDAEPFDGTLTGFRQTGPCEAEFTWNDRDGSGTVHIRFEPDLGQFLGHWGAGQPVPSLVFNGYRIGPPKVS
jgi:hypothetical protein